MASLRHDITCTKVLIEYYSQLVPKLSNYEALFPAKAGAALPLLRLQGGDADHLIRQVLLISSRVWLFITVAWTEVLELIVLPV